MTRSHLPGLLACSLLVVVAHHASASPSERPYRNPIVQDDGQPPTIIRKEPPTSPAPPTVTMMRLSASVDEHPFPNCPLYRVELDYPTDTRSSPVLESFSYGVYPNHPAINLDVFIGELNIKVELKGSRAELRKCQRVGSTCSLEDQVNSIHDVLQTEKWNIVDVYLEGGKLIVKVNSIVLFMSPLEPRASKGFTLVVGGPQDTSTWGSVPFIAYVNAKCDGPEQRTVPLGQGPTSTPTMHSSTGRTPTHGGFVTGYTPTYGGFVTGYIPTHGGFVTQDAIVETTTPAPASGISWNVGIVVVVLLGVMLVIRAVFERAATTPGQGPCC